MYWARDRHIAETNWSELQRLIALFFYIRTIIVFGSCTLIYDDKLFYLFDDVKIILLISVAEPHNCMRFNAIYSKAQHMKKKLGKNSKLFFTFFFSFSKCVFERDKLQVCIPLVFEIFDK